MIALLAPTASIAQERQKPATPRGDVGDWFPMDGYPPEARRQGEQGRVGVRLTVDKTGMVSACRVTLSSGSASLDARTCELALANGRFNPAKDANGEPIEATYGLPAVRWELSLPDLSLDGGAVTTTQTVEIQVDAQGKGISCQLIGDASAEGSGCGGFLPGVTVSPPLFLNGKPVAGKVTITTTTRIDPK